MAPEARILFSKVVAEATGAAHFVEVGAFLGKSAVYMAVEIINSGKSIKFDSVDLWEESPNEPKEKGGVQYILDRLGIHGDAFFNTYLTNIAPVRSHINPIRCSSVEAATRYPDASLDFVFLDAAHDAASVEADVRAWLPKVKAGGLLAGDDFHYPDVKEGIDACRLSITGTMGRLWLSRR
jgi:predicted O-methyltransferase YrrM